MNFRNLSKGLTLLRLNGKAGVIAQAIYSALSLSCGQCGVLSKGVFAYFRVPSENMGYFETHRFLCLVYYDISQGRNKEA